MSPADKVNEYITVVAAVADVYFCSVNTNAAAFVKRSELTSDRLLSGAVWTAVVPDSVPWLLKFI
jgi:hypothetical protein